MGLIKIVKYQTIHGKCPFDEWRDDLDKPIRAIVRSRIARIELGNFGDCKPIKGTNGLCELRIDVGPGYRIYFGKKHSSLIILLAGGDKGSQQRDIIKASKYWMECKDEQN